MSTQATRDARRRRGSITALAAVLMVIMLAVVALSVDTGVALVAKADLQRSADAAAHAGAMEYGVDGSTYAKLNSVRVKSGEWAEMNPVLQQDIKVSKNYFNSDPAGDILVGRIDFDDPKAGLDFSNPNDYNAVQVTVRRTEKQNGSIAFSFAQIFGLRGVDLEAKATAAMIREVRGFRGDKVPLLPITASLDHWTGSVEGGTNDAWGWDAQKGEIYEGADGIPEVILFPQRTGASGNFGTVNVGGRSNGTSTLRRQMRNGLSQSDMNYHGGELKLDSHGELNLGGNPGISAGFKNDLQAIAGEPKIIPLYDSVTGNGSNASFRIVKFVGVRVMSVDLKGGDKRIVVQPAKVVIRGAIQASPSQSGKATSSDIQSPSTIVL